MKRVREATPLERLATKTSLTAPDEWQAKTILPAKYSSKATTIEIGSIDPVSVENGRAGLLVATRTVRSGRASSTDAEFAAAETTFKNMAAATELLTRPRMQHICSSLGIAGLAETTTFPKDAKPDKVTLTTERHTILYASPDDFKRRSEALFNAYAIDFRTVEAVGFSRDHAAEVGNFAVGRVTTYNNAESMLSLIATVALPPRVLEGICLTAGDLADRDLYPNEGPRLRACNKFMRILDGSVNPSGILDIEADGISSPAIDGLYDLTWVDMDEIVIGLREQVAA
jgi:hypothetical protein